jgi:hypothetical protein
MRILVAGAFASAILFGATTAQAQRCTTQWNQFFRQYETRCDDGSTGTEKYNPFLKQWEQEIRPGYQPGTLQPTTRCTTKWNQFLRQWEQVCQ